MSEKAQNIGEMLAQLYTAAEAEIWLTTPHPQFYDKSPVQMIAANLQAEVENALRGLLDGVYT